LEEIGVQPNIWYQVKVRNEHNQLLSELQVAEHSSEGAHNNKNNHH